MVKMLSLLGLASLPFAYAGEWLSSELVKSGTIANEQFGAATSVSDDGSVVAVLQKQYSFVNDREAACQPELSGGTALTNQECYEAGGCKWSSDACAVSTGNVGKITVYAYDGSTYNKRGNDIFPSTSLPYDDGFFMKMSGDGNVIILRERQNTAFNTRAKVAIHGWDGTNYVLRDRVFDPSLNPSPSSWWGFKYALSADLSTDGSRIIVNENTAPAENDDGTGAMTNHGRALVFQWNAGTYDLMQTFYGTHAQQKLGDSVAISGDGNTVAIASRTMVACSQADVDALGADCGSVPSFCYIPASRHQNPQYPTQWKTTAGSCGTLLDVGGAFTFTFDGTTWQSAGVVHGAQAVDPDGYTSADDPAAVTSGSEAKHNPDFFQNTYNGVVHAVDHKAKQAKLGETISLNQDGTVLALGSRMGYGMFPNYGGSNGDGRVSNMGAAAVFDRSSGSWVGRTYTVGELATHPSTGAVGQEQLGKAVDLSADGSRFIVSSIYGYGRVKTFQWDGSDYVRQTDIEGQANEKIGQTTQGLQISSDGNDLVSGAYLTPGPNGENAAGKVVVHRWDSAGSRAAYVAPYQIPHIRIDDVLDVADLKATVADIGGCGSEYISSGFASWYETPSTEVAMNSGGSGQYYGKDTTVSGDGLVFGAITNNGVAIRRNHNGTWHNEHLGTLDYNAQRLSLNSDGTRLVVGDKTKDSNQGLVHMYDHNGTHWLKIGTLSGAAANAKFGSDVDIDSAGGRIVIGAYKKAYVYDFNGTDLNQAGSTIISNDDEISAVAISGDGDTIVLGIPLADVGSYPSHQNWGKTSVLRLDVNNNWQHETHRMGESENSECGFSVAVNYDGTVAASGCGYTGNNNMNVIHIFRDNGNTWETSEHSKNAYNYGSWGRAVALSSDGLNLVAGAPVWSAGDSKDGAGRFYYFRFIDNEWKQMAVKNAETPETGPYSVQGAFFGTSCDVSGDGSIIAIGQTANHVKKSSARVYELKSKLLEDATAGEIISAYGERSTSQCTD